MRIRRKEEIPVERREEEGGRVGALKKKKNGDVKVKNFGVAGIDFAVNRSKSPCGWSPVRVSNAVSVAKEKIFAWPARWPATARRPSLPRHPSSSEVRPTPEDCGTCNLRATHEPNRDARSPAWTSYRTRCRISSRVLVFLSYRSTNLEIILRCYLRSRLAVNSPRFRSVIDHRIALLYFRRSNEERVELRTEQVRYFSFAYVQPFGDWRRDSQIVETDRVQVVRRENLTHVVPSVIDGTPRAISCCVDLLEVWIRGRMAWKSIDVCIAL